MDILAFLDFARLLNNLVSLLWVGLGLGLVIFFHELGHFAVAKWCDVHVERFSIGFGPILWSRQRGETEYALSAVPFGGYVKMLGQDDMDPGQMTNEEVASNPRSYPSKKVGQRMAIISAGVIMNIITGLLFFAIAFRIGVPVPSANVGYTVAGSPAWKAGIEGGDRITHINDKPINSFMDVTINVTLTAGEITVKGLKKDGSEFEYLISPDTSGTRRTIGVGPEQGLRIGSVEEDGSMVAPPGFPAAKAGFKAEQTIVAVDGEKVDNYAVLAEILARRRASEVTLTVESLDEENPEASVISNDITIAPTNFQSLGVWMDLGTISDVRAGSVADDAGFKEGDKIVRVGENLIGTNFDPLRLPDLFADKAGQSVEVDVRRQEQGSGDTTVTLNVTPEDIPGWIARPQMGVTEPLSLASLGITLPISPRVVHVVPGSPAEEKGIKTDDVVTFVSFPNNPDVKDHFAAAAYEIDFQPEQQEGVTPKPVNWAYAFWRIQQLRTRDIVLTVKSGDTKKEHRFAPAERQNVEDWYLPIRSLFTESAQVVQKADNVPDAAAMGLHHTKNTATQIYLTLRSLFRGDMSSRELHGPIGIFKVGVLIAKEGISKLLLFLGFLSVNLAVLNFLPIPVLDGGHMVFLIWEAVTRRKPSERLVNLATLMGMVFVFGLMLYVVFLDIFVHWLEVM